MATQMFLRDAASDLGGSGQKALSTTRGAASVNKQTSATASGTSIVMTDTTGGTPQTFFTTPLAAVTIAGSITVNIRGREGATTVNATAGVKIERTDSAGNVLSTIVAEQTIPTTAAEYTTTDAAKNQAVTPTSTALSLGDRIKVTVLVKNVGTMAAGTVTNSIDGPTAATNGDTYVTFTETLTEVVLATGAPKTKKMSISGSSGSPDTPASIVDYQETNWSSAGTTKNTPTVTWQAGDLLVALATNENGSNALGISGGPGGWAAWGSDVGADSTHARGSSWAVTPASSGSGAVTFTNGVSQIYGGAVWVFRGSMGQGNRAAAADTAITISLTRSQDHSLVAEIIGDWAATAPSGAFTPSGSTSREATQEGTQVTVYAADWPDQGTAGATSYGRSAGSGTFTKVALEILGAFSSASEATAAISMKKMGIVATGTHFDPATYHGAVLTDKPSVYYRLGDSAAPAAGDPAVLNQVSAAMTGTVTFAQTGALSNDSDTAVSFPGTGTDYLQTASSPGSAYDLGNGPFSMEFWYKIAVANVAHNFISKGGNTPLARLTSANKFSLRLDTGGQSFTTTASFADTTAWHHVVMTWDGSTPHIYVDGVDAAGTNTITTFTTTTTGLCIGVDAVNKTVGPVNGLIDEVALYQSVLSQTRVTAHYNASISVSAATGAPSMKKMVIAGTSTEVAIATVAPKMKKMVIAGTSTEVAVATAAPAMKKMVISGVSTEMTVGTGVPAMKKMKPAGSGAGFSDASGAPKLKKMKISGAGAGISVATGGLKLKKMSIAGSGAGFVDVEGNVSMKKMSFSGAGAGISVASGGPGMKKMSVTAIGTDISTATGGPGLKKIVISGTGSGVSDASALIRLKKMGVAGAGAGIAVSSGGPSMKKMGIAGTSTEMTAGAGAISMKKMKPAGFEGEASIASISISLKKMGLSGSGLTITAGSGVPSMKKMVITGMGAGFIDIEGEPSLKKMVIAATGEGISDSSGAVRLKKMGIAAFSEEITFAAIAVSMHKMRVRGEAVKQIVPSEMFQFSML